ncbi:helix-turn-helix domain-containing protein [Mucilaginibacter boryungensis]|uniref:Helix-turn-helix domain-containing protein n=1 Tax=Mucilaginibacter boryungensis TaxID=768480 RepID=A0ABR9XIL8_9SPHI|nr:helix-turn-helix domain-containing protein [Mucilaginibacter boryungensis]MBE9667221.1 helix-turn-helix domain-containing protein [Mucilaginibacter boryungensis]
MKQPDLGKQIAALRTNRGLTQQELADNCKINIRSIQRIEAGEVVPRNYTINLLNTVLQSKLSNTVNSPNSTTKPGIPLKTAITGGIVFVINGLFVTYDLITKSLSPTLHLLTTVIHMLSCVFFIRGFYLIGQYYKNKLLTFGAILMMVLLPAINLLYILKGPVSALGELLAFILMSLSMILMGAGLLTEGLEYKGNPYGKIYKVAGINTIIISVTYLSLHVYIIYAGLIASLPANIWLVYLLYREKSNAEKPGLADDKLVLTS